MINRLILGVCLFSSDLAAVAHASTPEVTVVPPSFLDETFTRVATEVGVPEKLLRGICWVESNFKISAYNHGDGVGTNHAFGTCQVLHNTARDFGFKDPNCYRDFRESKTKNYNDCKLFGVFTSIFYGAKYLKAKLNEYEGDWEKAAAAYNMGKVIICKSGKLRRAKDGKIIAKCRIGHLANEGYVKKVMKAIEENR